MTELNTFEVFGFSSGFIAMIRVIYVDIESVLKVNGGLSAPFKVCRGIRQGCSLSGMLYAIAIEPLLPLEVTLKGCTFQRIFLLFVSRGISSAKVNWEKSCALQIGNGLE